MGSFYPLSANPPEKSEQSVSHDNLATLSPKLPSSENDTAKIQKILKYHTMIAEYKKIEAPIVETTGMMLYAVYIRDGRFEEIHPFAYTTRLLNVFDREEVAIAVVNAINKRLL